MKLTIIAAPLNTSMKLLSEYTDIELIKLSLGILCLLWDNNK